MPKVVIDMMRRSSVILLILVAASPVLADEPAEKEVPRKWHFTKCPNQYKPSPPNPKFDKFMHQLIIERQAEEKLEQQQAAALAARTQNQRQPVSPATPKAPLRVAKK